MAFAVEGDGVGFATESYAASALYTTLASLSGALWRIRRVSDDDIWDIAAISAFFALSNRMANVTVMRPNDEFYMMGRVPK